MELCVVLSVIAAVSVILAFLLLLHHKFKHSNPEDAENFLQDPRDQWFQVSDVCNFRTCSHEMWILFCMLVLVVCVVWSVQVGCVVRETE